MARMLGRQAVLEFGRPALMHMLSAGEPAPPELLDCLVHRIERLGRCCQHGELDQLVKRLRAVVRAGVAKSRCRPAINSATCMRFCVSVPVLSTASTEMAPSASTAGTRRVSTLCLEMRHAPSARNTVRITGISSGSIAMVSAMPAARFPASVPVPQPVQQRVGDGSSRPPMVRLRISRRDACCSGYRFDRGGQCLADAADRGGAGDGRTSAVPMPWSQRCWRTIARWHCPASLVTGTASPVSSDSLTSRCPSSRVASAAMRSPSCSTSRSPPLLRDRKYVLPRRHG